jgi:methionyl-tRNA formyltransferase
VRGERETGVTLMRMDAGMDTGAMLARWQTPIGEDETAGELSERLSVIGAQAVREALPRYLSGELVAEPQDGGLATAAPMLKKEDGAIDFTKSARDVHDHVRGMSPWPGAFTRLGPDKRVVKVLTTARTSAVPPAGAVPGEVVLADKARVVVACGGGGAIELARVQLEGKKAISAPEWVAGRGVKPGDRLG